MPTFQDLYKKVFGKRHRRSRLTLREMLTCHYFLFGLVNKTQAVIMAGYSPASAKWTAYRLFNCDLPTLTYYAWLFKRTRNGVPFPTIDDLIAELDKYDAFVYPPDVAIAGATPPTFDLDRMDNGNRRLAELYFEDQRRQGVKHPRIVKVKGSSDA